MADSKVITALEEQKWGKKAFVETYASNEALDGMFEMVDKQRELPSGAKPFVVRKDLVREAGDKITVPFVGKITGEGVDADNTLEGNEQEIATYSFDVEIDQKRQAARIKGRMSEQKSSVKLIKMFKPQLVEWAKDNLNKEITRKLAGAVSFTFANTPTASTTNRVVYSGSATGTGDMTSSDTIDLTDFTLAHSKAKNEYIAGTDGNYVSPLCPINFGKDKKFLALVHPSQYYTLLESARVQQLLRDTGAYQKDNPLIKGGDIIYNQVVIRPFEYLRESSVGNFTDWGSGSNVNGAIALFLGGCAAAIAESNDWRLTNEDFDYKNKRGTAIDRIYGVQKYKYNGEDLGVIAIKSARDSNY